MRFLPAFLIITALAAPNAHAVVDPDPDGIGVYFDLNADITETMASPSLPFWTYVILTNPTRAEIYSISFSFNIVVPPGTENSIMRVSQVVDFICIEPAVFHPLYGDVVCGGDVPIPGSPAVVLLSWMFMLTDTIPVDFYLGQSNMPDPAQQLAYESESGWVPMHVSSGDPALPVAMINGTGVVSAEATTFGRLKALYR